MTTYECNENQFIENLRKLLAVKSRVIVNRILTSHDDGRYGLSYLPDPVFRKYQMIARRDRPRTPAKAVKPFIEDRTGRLYDAGAVIHSGRRDHPSHMSVPYTRVEYSFAVWGDTYRHVFDALYEPDIRLEKRSPPRSHLAGKSEAGKSAPAQLVHVLRFGPPNDSAIALDLPSRVITLDARRRLTSLP